MSFATIQVRDNAQTILHSWFNALRTAGISVESELGSYLGGGFVGETAFSIANNQVSATDVTGLLLDKTLYRSAIVEFQLRRKTDSTENLATGWMHLRMKSNSWEEPVVDFGGDEHGVMFSMTSGGQVQYISDSLAGSNYVGELRFKVTTFGVGA